MKKIKVQIRDKYLNEVFWPLSYGVCLSKNILDNIPNTRARADHHFHDPRSDHDHLEKCDSRSDHDHLVQKK